MEKYIEIKHKILNCAFHIIKPKYDNVWAKLRLTIRNNFIRKRIKRKNKNGEKINVIFLVQFPEMWNSERSVFFEIANSKEFDTFIVCIPKYKLLESQTGYGFYETNEAYEFFSKNGYKAVNSITDNGWLDLQSIKPDYIFIQRPYSHQLPEVYSFYNLSKLGLLCYVPYGVDISNDFHKSIVFNKAFLKYCSIFFSDTEENRLYFDNNCFQKTSKAYLTGHPRFDLTTPTEFTNIGQFRRTVLWLPRWYLGENGNNNTSFFKYIDPLLEYFDKNNDCRLIIRPHPLMFEYFVSKEIWSEDEVNQFKRRISEIENVELDNEKDYLISFNKSDLLISDYTSLLLEYFVSKKPILYCGEEDAFNDDYAKMAQTFYSIHNLTDLKSTLDLLLLSGKDELKENREKVIERLIDTNQTASSKIVRILIKHIQGSN